MTGQSELYVTFSRLLLCGNQERKVDFQAIGEDAPNPVPAKGTARDEPARFDRYLLAETALAIVAAVLGIRAVSVGPASEVEWLLSPLVLIAAAFVPLAVRRRKLVDFGLSSGRIMASLVLLGWTCAALFPLVLGGLWVLRSFDIGLPMPPASPLEQGWMGWLFYQFMYVALAEEVFFRGYVQRNILRLARPLTGGCTVSKDWVSIAISAGVFAVAHVIIQGQIVWLMTFWPGLVLGWLFIRTRALLAPILFHGLANVCYVVMSGLFV